MPLTCVSSVLARYPFFNFFEMKTLDGLNREYHNFRLILKLYAVFSAFIVCLRKLWVQPKPSVLMNHFLHDCLFLAKKLFKTIRRVLLEQIEAHFENFVATFFIKALILHLNCFSRSFVHFSCGFMYVSSYLKV